MSRPAIRCPCCHRHHKWGPPPTTTQPLSMMSVRDTDKRPYFKVHNSADKDMAGKRPKHRPAIVFHGEGIPTQGGSVPQDPPTTQGTQYVQTRPCLGNGYSSMY